MAYIKDPIEQPLQEQEPEPEPEPEPPLEVEAISRQDALSQRAAATFDCKRRLGKVLAATPNGHGCLMQEDDDGDVEYKWRLTGITQHRFEHLVTQMRFRVGEGNGQCLYELGIANDGTPKGLPLSDYLESVETLRNMAEVLVLDTTILQEFMIKAEPEPLWCGEILITRRQAKLHDGRIAFCGSIGSGKSTLIAVLLTGELDDGSGSARHLLFNHKHEVCSGKTTSIVRRILSIENTEESLGISSPSSLRGSSDVSKSLSLIDLGGNVTKQMLFGLMSRRPDFTGICVSVENPAEEVTRYARVCRALRFPFFVVVTKVETVLDFELDAFLLELAVEFSSIGCSSVVLSDMDEVYRFQRLWEKSNQVPILCVSSADSSGIDNFRRFLASLPLGMPPGTPDHKFEVLLDGGFFVNGVGHVVRGHVARGFVELGSRCKIGPDTDGQFYSVTIQGIHVEGSHVTRVQHAEDATFALSELPSSVDLSQKGKLLISRSVNVCWEFEAQVKVLSQGMTPQLQPILYTGNVRQAVKIVSTLPHELQVLDTEGILRLRFLYHPEVLREGASIILQWNPEGIAVGEVIAVLDHFHA
ncbi:putative GTP-binding protein [Trypanosoma theileri]|uniref:Putative GTP-binding protein n=1 Tax=Trypanosoma theileri TaxID=67003 RepID=A0A1X0PAM4_9TRYP|nr:putative GTP-binding protein [Trypanosoma theileri]ORC93639.1 putative GTP-binding protein [Trypanosoma theileri]